MKLVRLLKLFLWLGGFVSQAVLAQGPWYVDGVQGVDAAGRGTSPAAPWKTIGYAMAQATPTGVLATDVILVAGAQVYSASTNGEVFPIMMRPGLALEGVATGSSADPVVRIPPASYGLSFDAAQSYLHPASRVRGLVFEGGASALRMGGGLGQSHAPLIERCEFSQQSGFSVNVITYEISSQQALLRDCWFHHSTSGVYIYGPYGLQAPLTFGIERCRFEDLQIVGVQVGGAGSGNLIDLDVEGCFFERLATGILMHGSSGSVVKDCAFRDIQGNAVRFEAWFSGAPSSSLRLEACLFVRCEFGANISATQDRVGCAIVQSVFLDCGTGIRGSCIGTPTSLYMTMEGNLVRRCAVGVNVWMVMRLIANRDRFEDCTVGLRATGGGAYVTATNVVFVGNQTGFFHESMWGILDGATLADNGRGVDGINQNNVMAGELSDLTITNSIFSGNGTDLFDRGGTAPLSQFVSNTCFQGSNFTHNGNLGLTNPLLSRPTYKLLPGSPCIDRGVPTSATGPTDFEGDPRILAGAPTAVPRMDLGADEFSFRGSARPYGTGGIGRNMVMPRISAASTEAPVGIPVQVRLAGALSPLTGVAGQLALLTFGWDDASAGLPMDLGVFGLSGSLLWNDAVSTFPIQLVNAAGSASYSVNVPWASYLIGAMPTFQWFVVMPTGELVGSDGLRVTIGQ